VSPFPGIAFTRFRTRHLAVPELFEVWTLAEWSKLRLVSRVFHIERPANFALAALAFRAVENVTARVFTLTAFLIYRALAVAALRLFQHRQHLTELVSDRVKRWNLLDIGVCIRTRARDHRDTRKYHEEQDKGRTHSWYTPTFIFIIHRKTHVK
jgi:hypothetical protein